MQLRYGMVSDRMKLSPLELLENLAAFVLDLPELR